MSQLNINSSGIPEVKVLQSFKEPIWFHYPNILFSNGAWRRLLGVRGDLASILNAVMRWAIYLGLISFALTSDLKSLYAIIATAIITYFIWFIEARKEQEFQEQFITDGEMVYYDQDDGVQRKVVYPTVDNPFMNPLLTDYIDRPNRIAASSTTEDLTGKIACDVNSKFYFNLYRDVDDIWEKENSQRQFYTTAATTIPNDQETFAKWCYGRVPTCKEGNGFQCVANNFDWLKDSYARNGIVPPFMELNPDY